MTYERCPFCKRLFGNLADVVMFFLEPFFEVGDRIVKRMNQQP